MSVKANILYISYDGMTDPLGQSQVLPYLAGLSAKGYRITLLSCEKQERLEFKETILTFCAKHHINWQPIAYTRKPPVLSTIKDVRQLKKAAAALHKEISFDLVHCRSYIAALAGQWMKKELAVPFLFDMRGLWADERVDGQLWPQSNPLYRMVYKYFKKKETQFLAEADAIISLTHAAKTEIESWPAPHAAVTVIPCCVDTTLFDPEALDRDQLAKLRRKADLPDHKLILGYVGSLGTWYLLSEMLSFFKVWLSGHPDTILFFVTPESKELVQQEAQQQQISTDQIRIISAKRVEMPYYIAMMDLGLFFIRDAYSKKASSPVKQGELMAMGVPVICNAGVGDSDYIIDKYNSGELVHSFTEEGYKDAITRLKKEMNHPESIRQGCFDYFDLEHGVAQYEEVYKSILKETV